MGLTECTEEEYESKEPTLTSDRECTKLTNCAEVYGSGWYEDKAPTKYADRTCRTEAPTESPTKSPTGAPTESPTAPKLLIASDFGSDTCPPGTSPLTEAECEDIVQYTITNGSSVPGSDDPHYHDLLPDTDVPKGCLTFYISRAFYYNPIGTTGHENAAIVCKIP